MMKAATLLLLLGFCLSQDVPQEAPQCSLSDHDLNSPDPNLKEMKYDVGDGEKSTLVYVEPPVASFYPPGEQPPSLSKVTPKFNGLAGKFINLSNQPTTLYW